MTDTTRAILKALSGSMNLSKIRSSMPPPSRQDIGRRLTMERPAQYSRKYRGKKGRRENKAPTRHPEISTVSEDQKLFWQQKASFMPPALSVSEDDAKPKSFAAIICDSSWIIIAKSRLNGSGAESRARHKNRIPAIYFSIFKSLTTASENISQNPSSLIFSGGV